MSEISSDTLRRAHAVHPISAVQVEYSPFALDIEDPKIALLNTCRELGVSIVAYSPLSRGFLSGTIKSRDDIKGDYRFFWPRFSEENFDKNIVLVDRIKAIADRRNITLGQATLSFLLAQGPDIIPIPGTKRVQVLQENLAALRIELSEDEIDGIREAAVGAVPAGDRYPDVFVSPITTAAKDALLMTCQQDDR
jgi:aryl-alcohol dehydrogenase-like predicted oxidoreductase